MEFIEPVHARNDGSSGAMIGQSDFNGLDRHDLALHIVPLFVRFDLHDQRFHLIGRRSSGFGLKHALKLVERVVQVVVISYQINAH